MDKGFLQNNYRTYKSIEHVAILIIMDKGFLRERNLKAAKQADSRNPYYNG